MKRLRIAALALLLGTCASGFAANGAPQPFVAQYSVNWRGMNAGTTEVELKPDPKDASGKAYEYASRANARGMFRAFFNDEITQVSWFVIEETGVRPLRYRADDGSDDTGRDISLDFDWNAKRVTGTAEDKPVALELTPGVQDVMSMQIATVRDLARGEVPASYVIVDKDRIKRYSYVREPDAKLKTALGELDTVVYRSQREGSKRAMRTWYAPSLGFVPVRAERLREGKREMLMEIRELKR
jgi:hypothetical protein